MAFFREKTRVVFAITYIFVSSQISTKTVTIILQKNVLFLEILKDIARTETELFKKYYPCIRGFTASWTDSM